MVRIAYGAVIALFCLPIGVGCQDADTANSGTSTTPGAPVVEDAGSSTPPGEDTSSTPSTPDTTPNANPLDTPCETNDDCDSGLCIDTSQGKLCTRPCLEDCPAPFECKMLTNDAGQPIALCLDPYLNLCNPCSGNLECNQTTSNNPNLCVDFGEAGSFCAIHCQGEDATCPEGYSCSEIPGPNGLPSQQCLPVDDACNCNEFGKSSGVGTECSVVNEFGSCKGFRVCGSDGLEACEGIAAQEEVCNGEDDDCDGQVDETASNGSCEITNEFGSCPGVIPCEDEELACVGPSPQKELCNGVDDNCDGTVDEGFEDADGDGTADCVDVDSDGDGTPNALDCDPNDPEKNAAAEEVCNGLDDDCDGLVDEEDAVGCQDFYLDLDADKHGDPDSEIRCFCWDFGNPVEFYTATIADDCDDLNPNAYPGADEQCNGEDDDCDGDIDEAQFNALCDISNAFGSCPGQLLCTQGGWSCLGQTPTAEVCNKVDDDCDGDIDEDVPDFDLDGTPNCYDDDDDNDGFLDPVDCGPLDPTTYPGAVEVCDGVDNDCNGVADDPGAQGCSDYYQDADGDGHGSSFVPPMCLCGPNNFTFFTATQAGDCKDIDALISPTQPEECDGIDQNCNGDIDEGVSSPCGDCSEACIFGQGEGETFEFDISPENTIGMSKTQDGGLTLDSSELSLPFIWIANSGAGTVSKLNTASGCEVARYKVCNDPSRTAVDLDGNGIIGCRGDGGVAKIGVFLNDCIDKNGNGKIDTSSDLDNNCTISNAEMHGNDECIVWQVYPDGATVARAAGVDKDNNIWIGFHSSSRVKQIDGDTGATLKSFNLTGRPYGLAIDSDGIIWYASRSGSTGVGRIHPQNGETNWYSSPGDPYGIAIDPFGYVWVAFYGASSIGRLDPNNGNWWNSGNLGWGGTRGVAVSVNHGENGQITESRVYTAHSSTGRISVLNAFTKEYIGAINLGNGGHCPVGVAIDSTNHIWSVNQCTSTACKVDPDTWNVEFTKQVGSNPYTYSDMTGYALKTITAPVGVYRTKIKGWSEAQTVWDRIIVDATLPGNGLTWLDVYYRFGDTEDALANAEWQGPHGPFPPDNFPLEVGVTANNMEVELRFYTDEPTTLPVLHALKVIAFKD
jgi:hypothetical protein